MAAALRRIEALASLIDLIIEVRDARVPAATSISGLHGRLQRKPRLVLLNRADLAQPSETKRWLARLSSHGIRAFAGIGLRAGSLSGLRSALLAQPARSSRIRAIVIGAPNTGKSSVINALSRNKRAVVRNQPGVTRQLQWLPVSSNAELLDTPGVLPPRISGPDIVWKLALCGILPDAACDAEQIAERFSAWCVKHRPQLCPDIELESVAQRRGRKHRHGELDRAAAARDVVTAFRAASLGRITLEFADGEC